MVAESSPPEGSITGGFDVILAPALSVRGVSHGNHSRTTGTAGQVEKAGQAAARTLADRRRLDYYDLETAGEMIRAAGRLSAAGFLARRLPIFVSLRSLGQVGQPGIIHFWW